MSNPITTLGQVSALSVQTRAGPDQFRTAGHFGRGLSGDGTTAAS
jgi:hypothetical protein